MRLCCSRTCPCSPFLFPVGTRRMREEGETKAALPSGSFVQPSFYKHVLWLQAFLRVVLYVREQKTDRLHSRCGLKWFAGGPSLCDLEK